MLGRGGDAEGDSLVGVANVYGSLLPDLLTGDDGANNLRGRDGDDTLVGGEGNDTLEGGLGRNLHLAGAGDDSLRSRENIDTLYGGEGDDTFAGGGLVFGESGDDVLLVDGQFLAAQTVDGGSGDDLLFSPHFDDILDGGEGSDTIVAGGGRDTILGGADADSLLGGEGDDSILGGAGDDTIVGWRGADRLDGGEGRDWLDLRGETQGIVVALDNAALLGVEAVAGGSGADLLEGSAADDTLLGGGGADTLRGLLGHDSLSGGDGDDSLLAEAGFVTLDGGAGADWLDGGLVAAWLDYRADTVGVTINLVGAVGRGGIAEGDRVSGLFGAVLGGSGADHLISWDWHTTLAGGAGDDTMSNGYRDPSGNYANAEMFGGAGDDDYLVRNRYDLVVEAAGDGLDRILTTLAVLGLPQHVEQLGATGAGARRLIGNDLDNTITGGWVDDTLFGGDGNDVLAGGRGADRLWGGLGDDRYWVDAPGDVVVEMAGRGRDSIVTTLAVLQLPLHVEMLYGASAAASRLSGNGLDNLIRGGGNDDTLWGAGGADTLDGGIGADLLIGGAGDDLYRAGADDVVREGAGQGQDTVIALNEPEAVLAANVEVLVLLGAAALDGTGNVLDNILVGQSGTNLLRGLGGRDSLMGGAGADTLVGGPGADTLTGGAQGDLFRLDAALDSLPEAADLVTDFRFAEGDRVDLRGIDANRLLAGDQAFVWIGGAAFAGGAAGAGQWRVVAAGPGVWRGEGDTDGDGDADLAIEIAAATAALEGWFLL